MLFILQNVDRRLGLRIHQCQRGFHMVHDRPQRGRILQHLACQTRLIDECPQHVGFMMLLVDLMEQTFESDQLFKNRQQPATGDEFPAVLESDFHPFDGEIREIFVHRRLVLEIPFGLAFFHLKQRRLGDINVAALQQLGHLAEEEGEQQRADVTAVHIGVGHEHDFVIPRSGDVECVLVRLVGVFFLSADACAKRQNQRADFIAAEHLVEAGLFDIEDFALEREDSLEFPIATLFGRTTGGISLDDEQLTQRRIFFGTVGQLAG